MLLSNRMHFANCEEWENTVCVRKGGTREEWLGTYIYLVCDAGNRCTCTVTFVVGVVSCGVGVPYSVY